MEIIFSKVEEFESIFKVKIYSSIAIYDNQFNPFDGSNISIYKEKAKVFFNYEFVLISKDGEDYLNTQFESELIDSLLSMIRFCFRVKFEEKLNDFELIKLTINNDSLYETIESKIEEVNKNIKESTLLKEVKKLIHFGKNNNIKNYNDLVYLEGKSSLYDYEYNKFATNVFNTLENESNIRLIEYLKKMRVGLKKRIGKATVKTNYSFSLKNKSNTKILEAIISKFQSEFEFLDLNKCNSSDLINIFKSANFKDEKIQIYSGCNTNLFSYLLISLDGFFSNLTFKSIADSNCFYPNGKEKSFSQTNLKTSSGNFKKATIKIDQIENIIYEIKHNKNN